VQTYKISPLLLQDDRASEELPFGSRGGLALQHQFPSDGEYLLKINLQRAQSMTSEDRENMIRGMVDGLEERLKSAPADLEGWQRLIKARAVLGEMDKARGAYRIAREQFKDDVKATSALAQSAKELGIE